MPVVRSGNFLRGISVQAKARRADRDNSACIADNGEEIRSARAGHDRRHAALEGISVAHAHRYDGAVDRVSHAVNHGHRNIHRIPRRSAADGPELDIDRNLVQNAVFGVRDNGGCAAGLAAAC